jgi:hypothetical protein
LSTYNEACHNFDLGEFSAEVQIEVREELDLPAIQPAMIAIIALVHHAADTLDVL